MERRVCTPCNIEKLIENSYNKYTEFKICNSERSLNIYYENKDKL